MNKYRLAWAVSVLLLTIGLILLAFSVGAGATSDKVCSGLDSGKVDVQGSTKTVTLTAPDGFLIDSYCVKAGSVKQGNGPVYVPVDPPQASITITHPSGKDISHWSYSVTEVPPSTTTTVVVTTTTIPTTTTTIPPTTTTVPSTTTTVPDTTTTTVAPTTTTLPTTTTTVPTGSTTTTTVPTTTTSTVPSTTTTVPQTTTTVTAVPVTTTVPSQCDESHPLWQETTQTCELPYTGVDTGVLWDLSYVALMALLVGSLLALVSVMLDGRRSV